MINLENVLTMEAGTEMSILNSDKGAGDAIQTETEESKTGKAKKTALLLTRHFALPALA